MKENGAREGSRVCESDGETKNERKDSKRRIVEYEERAKRCRMRHTSEKLKGSKGNPDRLNILANDVKV